jgi:hypothetical protein
MPKAYRVLAEKYQTLLESDQPEQEYKLDPADSSRYATESYSVFVKKCMEATSYDDFRYICKEFYHRPLIGGRYREMFVHANVLNLAVEVEAALKAKGSLLSNPRIVDYLYHSIYMTIVSFTRMEYSDNYAQANRDQNEAKEAWELWNAEYTKYKEIISTMQKSSDTANVSLDI